MTPAEQTRAIIAEVAAKHGLRVDDLTGPSRYQEIVAARDEAIIRLHKERGMTPAKIAPLFNRERNTIAAAFDRERHRAYKRKMDRKYAAQRVPA
jgi:chromosomal replication initiation ATPase DnaA